MNMTNITAGFLLAAYVLYIVARGHLGRLLWIVGASPTTGTGNVTPLRRSN